MLGKPPAILLAIPNSPPLPHWSMVHSLSVASYSPGAAALRNAGDSEPPSARQQPTAPSSPRLEELHEVAIGANLHRSLLLGGPLRPGETDTHQVLVDSCW